MLFFDVNVRLMIVMVHKLVKSRKLLSLKEASLGTILPRSLA